MNIAKKYGDVVRGRIPEHPDTAGKLIRLGLKAESARTALAPTREMPKAYRYLNHQAIKLVADALDEPRSFVWTNIFAPTELLQAFGLSAISMECIASYMSGFHLEDYFIDQAEASGIATTLCSYHKNFIGAYESGVFPEALGALTTSIICDGNINTFRYLNERFGLDDFVIDVPHVWSPEAQEYVVGQLEDLIVLLEKATGISYDEQVLATIIERENRSRKLYRSFLAKRVEHDYPESLISRLFLLFATHLSIGSAWALEFFEMLDKDIDSYPPASGRRLFWVHVTPYMQPTLCHYLNYDPACSIVADDFNLDYQETMDSSRPLHALARKMINNIYNGDFDRKADAVVDWVREYHCDAVVEFCHWGCKQSIGGAALLKERMKREGIPMLTLDGDALDRRNNQDGQTKTRFEAFLEVIDNTASSSPDGVDATVLGGSDPS